MKTTVIICTWNRAASLDRTLSSFAQLGIPAGTDWELLVVNNNCTDETEQVVARHAAHLPIRQVLEPQAGLSFARNRGVVEARGDLIVWTDDDVTVDKDWLTTYVRAAHDQPEFDFWGGSIVIDFEENPPTWLARAVDDGMGVEAIYGHIDWDCEETEIDESKTPFGGNFSVRTDVQRSFLFNTDLGRKKNESIAGEETAIMQEMLRHGHRGRALPQASLKHRVPAEHMTLDYITQRFAGAGRTTERMMLDPKSRFALHRKVFLARIKYRIYRWLDCPDRWVRYMGRVYFFQARLSELAHNSADVQVPFTRQPEQTSF